MVILYVVRDQYCVVCLVEDLHDCERNLQWVYKGDVVDCIVDVFGPYIIVYHHRVGQLCVVLCN